jgi:hypothetical protein
LPAVGTDERDEAMDDDDGERMALGWFLRAQRASVLAIVDGLDAAALTAPVPLPSGWTPLGMIEETARHAGHLDAVRELLDGTTGLGPR